MRRDKISRIVGYAGLLAAGAAACGGDRGWGTGNREAIADNLGLDAAVLSHDGGFSSSARGANEMSSAPEGAEGAEGAEGCASYEESFVPLVVDPVCSKCHGTNPGLPDWGVYSVARTACSSIGELVSAGEMPPPSSGFSLTESQKQLVSEWVGLGCPQTASEASALCPESGGTGGSTADAAVPAVEGTDSAAPPPAGALAVSRVEWDPDKGELRIEGEVSDTSATITVRFAGRVETLAVDGGRFRGEFSDVPMNPGTVTIESSGGESVTVTVTVD